MDRLWAPWRMAYIEVPRAEGCVFCAKPAPTPGPDAGREAEREQLILHRGRLCFVVMNLFPYNNGHVMVVPHRHTSDLTSLDAAELAELMALTQLSLRALRDAFRPDGFNLGMNLGHVAGAGIADHLHMHIVPRWSGDTNFMPVLGETKVLPDALFGSYDKLRTAFDALTTEG